MVCKMIGVAFIPGPYWYTDLSSALSRFVALFANAYLLIDQWIVKRSPYLKHEVQPRCLRKGPEWERCWMKAAHVPNRRPRGGGRRRALFKVGRHALHPFLPCILLMHVDVDVSGLYEEHALRAAVVKPLADMCVSVIASNFKHRPTLRGIPTRYIHRVTELLPTTLALEVTAPLIDDEAYWKRCALSR
eukprot:2306824-Pleurochrysis_carterae.AAC.4